MHVCIHKNMYVHTHTHTHTHNDTRMYPMLNNWNLIKYQILIIIIIIIDDVIINFTYGIQLLTK